MTHGAVIFAQNNAQVDYIKIAIFSAKQVIKHLGIPVTLVTDNPDWLNNTYPNDVEIFDRVIVTSSHQSQTKKFYDGSLSSKKFEWKNFTRSQVYELSPYDKTLVIDSDYIINSSILKSALDSDYDFQIYRNSFDLAGWRDVESFTNLNQYSIPFYWATVFVFEKTPVTESFFTLVNHIKENWEFYRILHSIDNQVFRNDFAFSIAIHIMNGNTDRTFATKLPGTMSYVLDRDFLVSMKDDKMQFLVEKQTHHGEYTLVKTTGIDVHVMNKYSLSRFIDGGTGV
jgi:hypothetical protein